MEQPLTARRVLAMAGLAAVAAALVFAVPRVLRWWEARPKSVVRQQQVIWNYLEKKSGRDDFRSGYDFTLRPAVNALQTNVLTRRAGVSLLHTNIARVEREVRALQREAGTLTETERTAKRRLDVVSEKITDQQRRLAIRLAEVSVQQSNVTALATNRGGEAATTAGRMERAHGRLQAAREALTAVQTNLAGVEEQRRGAEREFATRHAAAEARRAELAKQQAELKNMQTSLNAQEKDLQAVRRETAAKEQALASAAGDFARETRKALKEAGSYEAIYAAIGRLLWTGERLLDSIEPREQRQGLAFLDEAAQAAVQGAEDAWLAARICQAYVWPNVGLHGAPGRPSTAVDALLGNCNGIFQRAGETNLVERNYRLMLEYAPTSRRADAIRYNLGYLLEESGAWPAALEVYGAIQDTNYLAPAQKRIAAVEQKRGGSR